MARADDGNSLSQLTELLDILRSKGVVKYLKTATTTEILMGPPAAAKAKALEKDPLAGKRAHYMNLLGRSHMTDAELELLPDAI